MNTVYLCLKVVCDLLTAISYQIQSNSIYLYSFHILKINLFFSHFEFNPISPFFVSFSKTSQTITQRVAYSFANDVLQKLFCMTCFDLNLDESSACKRNERQQSFLVKSRNVQRNGH